MTAKEFIEQYNEGRRDFSGVNLFKANLYKADLTESQGLDLSWT